MTTYLVQVEPAGRRWYSETLELDAEHVGEALCKAERIAPIRFGGDPEEWDAWDCVELVGPPHSAFRDWLEERYEPKT